MSQSIKSIIDATREGFTYQDRYALLLFLREIKNKRLRQFFVDYPFGSRKSLDIRIVSVDGEKIYEIKAGDEFKQRKTEIYKTLASLYDYEKEFSGSPCQKNLIVSPGNEALFNNLKSNLEHLKTTIKITNRKTKLTHGQSSEEMANDFVKDFNKCTKNKLETSVLLNFLKTLNVPIVGPSLSKYEDDISELDKCIVAELHFFLKKASATNGEAFVSGRVIMLELLDLIQCGAGSKNDLLPSLQEKLCECIGRRIAFDAQKRGGNIDEKIEECIRVVKSKIMQVTGIITDDTLSASVINEPEIIQ